MRIYAGVALIDNLGAAACVVHLEDCEVNRGRFTHEGLITREPLAYSDEAAVSRALRSLCKWPLCSEQDKLALKSMKVYAGSVQVTKSKG